MPRSGGGQLTPDIQGSPMAQTPPRSTRAEHGQTTDHPPLPAPPEAPRPAPPQTPKHQHHYSAPESMCTTPDINPDKATLPKPTPPTPFRRNSDQVRTSSAWDSPSSGTTRNNMDMYLYNELYGTMARDVPGLLERLTNFPQLPELPSLYEYAVQQGLYTEAQGQSGRWAGWPQGTPTEKTVLAWLDSVVTKLSAEMARIHKGGGRIFAYSTAASLPLTDGDCLRKADIVLSSMRSHNTDEDPYDPDMFSIHEQRISWKAVRLAGELKQSTRYSNYDSTIAQLANYVREIFGAQQTRMWVHGFTLCGEDFRAWIFDRDGGLGTKLINIHKEPLLFVKAIIGFACMDATELGFDPTIRWKPEGEAASIVYDATIYHSSSFLDDVALPFIEVEIGGSTKCLEINVMAPLARRIAINSRGTAVFAARMCSPNPMQWDFAVKEQWRAPTMATEETIFRSLSLELPAIGLPLFHFHQDMGRVSTLVRQGIDLSGVMVEMPSSESRRSEPIVDNNDSKADQSASKKRIKLAMSKVGASGGRMVGGSDDNKVQMDLVGEASLLTAGIWRFSDRTKSRLVISPIGRPLHKFKTYTELLVGIRDAIKGCWHLYSKYGYLHRDVSINNVVLVEDATIESNGMLIDFDMAVVYNSQRSGAVERTGTFDFMAIGILQGSALVHTPLHDLESFLYILLYLGTCYTNGKVRVTNHHEQHLFRPPTRSTYCLEDRGRLKLALMGNQNFQGTVLGGLDDGFRKRLGKMLVRLRDILWPYISPDPSRLLAVPRAEGDVSDSDSDLDFPADNVYDPVFEEAFEPTFMKFLKEIEKTISRLEGA